MKRTLAVYAALYGCTFAAFALGYWIGPAIPDTAYLTGAYVVAGLAVIAVTITGKRLIRDVRKDLGR
jgi:hypothetical protein